MRKGKLMIAQVDHSSGEVIGHSIQKLYQMGAKNVQLLQSVTKKNRPGYVFFIDLPEGLVEKVSIFLGTELGIWGYHLMDTEHVHFDVSFQEKTLVLTNKQYYEHMILKPKYIKNGGQLLSIKVDHDQLVDIQSKFQEWGYEYSLVILRSTLESKLRMNENLETITLVAENNTLYFENQIL